MCRLPFRLRLKLCGCVLPLIARSKLIGLLFFALVFFLLAEKTGAQLRERKSYIAIDVDTLAREPNLVKCAEARLEEEKKKESKDQRFYGLIVLQTDLEQIEVESLNGKPFSSGWLDCRNNMRWYSFHHVPQRIFIKTAFSCPYKVRVELSDHQPIFYYRINGIESEIEAPMVSIPGDAAAIDSFCLSATEITNAQFCEFLNDSAASKEEVAKWIDWENEFSLIKKENARFVSQETFTSYPAVLVSAYGAKAFCAWLSAREKRRYRLPTPEEWEWAAQGANRRRNDVSMPLRGNFHGSDGHMDKWRKLAPVDELSPDTLGIRGLWGNVWEWTQFLPGKNFAAMPPEAGSDAPNFQTIYGGSWLFSAEQIRAASSAQVSPDFRSFAIGFRVVQPCRNDE